MIIVCAVVCKWISLLSVWFIWWRWCVQLYVGGQLSVCMIHVMIIVCAGVCGWAALCLYVSCDDYSVCSCMWIGQPLVCMIHMMTMVCAGVCGWAAVCTFHVMIIVSAVVCKWVSLLPVWFIWQRWCVQVYVGGQHPQASILSILQPVVGVLWSLFCVTRTAVYSIKLVTIWSFSLSHVFWAPYRTKCPADQILIGHCVLIMLKQ